jgi:hypothetical protein
VEPNIADPCDYCCYCLVDEHGNPKCHRCGVIKIAIVEEKGLLTTWERLEHLSRRFFVQTMITWDRRIFRVQILEFRSGDLISEHDGESLGQCVETAFARHYAAPLIDTQFMHH